MNEKLQEFIDKGIIFYPSQNEQILESEELRYVEKLGNTKHENYKPHIVCNYWIRDEDYTNKDYKEFINEQIKLITERFNRFLSLQKII